MKTISKIEILTIKNQSPQKYKTIDDFVAAKLKDASESLKKVDLSLIRK